MKSKNINHSPADEPDKSDLDNFKQLGDKFSQRLYRHQLDHQPYQAYSDYLDLSSFLRKQAGHKLNNKEYDRLKEIAQTGKAMENDWQQARRIFDSQIKINGNAGIKSIPEPIFSNVESPPAERKSIISGPRIPVRLHEAQKNTLIARLQQFFIEQGIKYDKINFLQTDQAKLADGLAVLHDALKRGLARYPLGRKESIIEVDNLSDCLDSGFLVRNRIAKIIDHYYQQFYNPDQASYQEKSIRDLAIWRDEFVPSFFFTSGLKKNNYHNTIFPDLVLKPNLDREVQLVAKIELRQQLLPELFFDIQTWYEHAGVKLPDIHNNLQQAAIVRTALLYFVTSRHRDEYQSPPSGPASSDYKKEGSDYSVEIELFLLQIWRSKFIKVKFDRYQAALEYLQDLLDQALQSIQGHQESLKRFFNSKSGVSMSSIMSLFGRGGLSKYLIVKIPDIITDRTVMDKLIAQGKMIQYEDTYYPSVQFLESFHQYRQLNQPVKTPMQYNDRIKKWQNDFNSKNTVSKERPVIRKEDQSGLIFYKSELLDQFVDYHQQRTDKQNWYFLAQECFRDFHNNIMKKHSWKPAVDYSLMDFRHYPDDPVLKKKLFDRLHKLGQFVRV